MMMTRLPGAVWRPISYADNAAPFTQTPNGWLLHVVVGNGDPGPYWETLGPGRRAFAHGWVAKDGHGVQYQSLDRQAWHAAQANPWYWGFETEGYPNEPLTQPQIDTLARWHVALGVPDAIMTTAGGTGVGCHYQGGASWGGHTCPDPVSGQGPRSRQRPAILQAVAELRTGGTKVTKDDAQLFLQAFATWDVSGQIQQPSPVSFQTAFGRMYRDAEANAAALKALVAEVTYLAGQVSILTAAHPAPGGAAPVNIPKQKD